MAKNEIPTGYELSRQWFDYSFENPDKVRPVHTALYFFAIEHCNRLGWKPKFGLPRQMTMDAIGVKNDRTFSNAFNDLVDWGFFILHEKSVNQHSANVIALVKNTVATTSAHTKATQRQIQKQRTGTYIGTVAINKQENNKDNLELGNAEHQTKDNKQELPSEDLLSIIQRKERDQLTADEFQLIHEAMKQLATNCGGLMGFNENEIEKYITKRASDNWQKPQGKQTVKINVNNIRHDMKNLKNDGWLSLKQSEPESTFNGGVMN